nr:hypothetical protein GCM10025730_18030 [Promicromonospora thailandica]
MPRPRPERSLTLPDDAPPRPAPDPDLAATLSAALPVALADGLPGGLPGVDWPDFGDHDDCARRAVAAVAAMLGRPVPERPKDPRTSAEWLARRWDVDESALVNVSRDMSRTLQRLHGYALQRWIDRHADDVAVFGPGGAPQRAALDLGNGTSVSVPAVATVLFPAGSAYDSAVAVEVAYRYGTPTVTAFTPPGGLALAERVLADLTRTLETDHPYRGGVLSARSSTGSVELTPVTHTPQARGDVVLPADLWREVDLFCSSVTTRRDALRALGHTTSRGLLLAGRPGVGKTKLARVIATELAGPLTVVLVTAEVLRTWMTELYDEIRGLGPCLVVLEEIDSVAAKGRAATPRSRSSWTPWTAPAAPTTCSRSPPRTTRMPSTRRSSVPGASTPSWRYPRPTRTAARRSCGSSCRRARRSTSRSSRPSWTAPRARTCARWRGARSWSTAPTT